MPFAVPSMEKSMSVLEQYEKKTLIHNLLTIFSQHPKTKQYRTHFPAFNSKQQAWNDFLKTVAAGAILYDCINVLKGINQDPAMRAKKKQILHDIFTVTLISDIDHKDLIQCLGCLTHFLQIMNKQNPTVQWSDVDNNELIASISAQVDAIMPENLLNKAILDAKNSSAVVQTHVTTLRNLDSQRYLSWMRAATPIDPKLQPNATFLRAVAEYIEANKDTLSRHKDLRKLITASFELVLKKIISGAMLLVTMDIIPTAASTTPLKCPLAKHLLSALEISSLSEVGESDRHSLNALAKFIQITPEIQWHPLKENEELLSMIEPHITHLEWVDLGVSTKKQRVLNLDTTALHQGFTC